MGVEFAAERRLLSEAEYEPIVRSHYPTIADLPAEDLVELARWLRSQRDRAQGIVRNRRRIRRGKAEAQGTATETASERGLAAKKQVFVRALKRVNNKLHQINAAARKAKAQDSLHAALARRQAIVAHHPSGGMTARSGLRSKASRRRRTNVPPGRIGSVSQAGKAFQAARDQRGA